MCVADVLAHKRMPQIVTVLLAGPHRFSELRKAVPGISEKVLSYRLAQLRQAGIVSRIQYLEIPPRVEYELTSGGLAMIYEGKGNDTWLDQVPLLNFKYEAPGLALGYRLLAIRLAIGVTR